MSLRPDYAYYVHLAVGALLLYAVNEGLSWDS